MAAELNFSPPEVPEPTFLENLLRYGLFLGAIFQLICVLAIIFPISKSHEGSFGNQLYGRKCIVCFSWDWSPGSEGTCLQDWTVVGHGW
ncbi:protein MANBAL isoform X1 [Sminthopsis crassicaudata]|uniref:protein MANBAL isoform X1 n=1 Tax=Sminthopsis crassicaudata TaxID=9301 RepID=UPI003D69577E